MASILSGSQEKTFSFRRFLGLNETSDGDAKLKFGEASEIRNWQVTRDGSLRRRPGAKHLANLSTGYPVKGLWNGLVGGEMYILAACDGMLYRIEETPSGNIVAYDLKSIETNRHVLIFGFNGNAYIIDGSSYFVFDGEDVQIVQGYRPLIAITIKPNGEFETAEQINKLTGERRGWLSPDGNETTFQLPESGIESIDYVKDLKTGQDLPDSAYSYNLQAGTLTFASKPDQSVNSYEVGWTMSTSFRDEVIGMQYFELYSGNQDNRIILYGDGSATAIYTGLDYDGKPRADYFPDLAEITVGDTNTPITGLIRHYSSLLCFKSDSAWSLQFGITSLSDESLVPAFYSTPINRQIGNVAMGQVQLVNNAPMTLSGRDVYQWSNSSYYNSNLTSDERQAIRVSDRIQKTLSDFELSDCICYDDNYHQEYYINYGELSLVYHYAADAWSVYTNIGAICMTAYKRLVLFGTANGDILCLDEDAEMDSAYGEEQPIPCYWESGSIDFGQEFMQKHSSALWVALKPTAGSSVTVTVQTDRKETFAEKIVDADKVRNPGTREPYLKRLKLKAKKFLYYKLILTNDGEDNSPTVVGADVRVRFTGYAK